MDNLCFGQRIDPELGILQPWYTHGALDSISQMKLHNKIVWEFGGGSSSIWWAKKARTVYTVESNVDWYAKIIEMKAFHQLDNLFVRQGFVNEGDQARKDEYVKALIGAERPDIIIADGIFRFEVIELALELRPSILIVDNWQQDYVFICPKAEELLNPFPKEIHLQEDHKDHSGRPWQTAIFYL